MNFKPKQVPPRQDPVLNMQDLARRMGVPEAPNPVQAYTPPAVREAHQQDIAIEQVRRFGDLPTRELDELVAAAKAEIAALEADAQAVRDMYMKHTARIAADIKRLQEGVKLSMETIKALHAQCANLDEPLPSQEQKPVAEAE